MDSDNDQHRGGAKIGLDCYGEEEATMKMQAPRMINLSGGIGHQSWRVKWMRWVSVSQGNREEGAESNNM